MKRLDNMFCASQASTAICLSVDHIEKSSTTTTNTTTTQLSGRALDRNNPIIRDCRRSFSTPCSSLQPINPKPPYRRLQKTKMISADDGNNRKHEDHMSKKKGDPHRKSSASSLFKLLSDDNSFARKSVSCGRPAGDFIRTPPGSSRNLVGDPDVLDGLSDYDPVLGLVNPSDPKKSSQALNNNNKDDKSVIASNPKSPSVSEKKNSSDQVVVLRVSLHCKGCEGKVRKHLSKMQGVTSFNVDFAAKKVTVTGDVTPLEVLASISKVKNAQLWTPPPPSSERVNPEIKK